MAILITPTVVDEVCMTEEDKTGGYKFAVALLAASGSILYLIYNYIQNTAIHLHSYYLICLMITGAAISLIGFLAYLFIKGYLMEAQGSENTESLNKIASWLYIYSLLFFAFLVYGTIAFFFKNYTPTEILKVVETVILVTIGLFLFIFAFVYIYLHLSNKIPKETSSSKKSSSNKKILAGFFLAVVTLLIWILLYLCVVFYPPLHGHVEVDMESIYYKNDTQISVLIQATGPNTGLLAVLYKELSGNLSNVSYIGPIEPIFVDSESNLEERNIESNNVLIGNYLGNGKYSVFIDTTNLTTGYYELTCLRIGFYEKTCESKSFYLLNRG